LVVCDVCHSGAILRRFGEPSRPALRSPIVSELQRLRPRNGATLTAQGHPSAIFRRAVERKNLLIAEATARELGALNLSEALDLVCLVAEQSPERLDAFARRWLARLASERPLRLAELDIALTALRALPSPRAADALRSLLVRKNDDSRL
jgi:hypothetical protein